MNGIDLLYIVGGLIVLFILWEAVSHYHNWLETDRYQRRQRRLQRIQLNDILSERSYRNQLRHMLLVGGITVKFNLLTSAFTEATKSFENFSEKLTVFNKLLVEDPQEKHTI